MNAKSVRDQAVRDAKTNIILDAALQVFSARGYHETRLEDIAASAGFSKAALYNYYQDKEEIFLSLAIREYERLLEKVEQTERDGADAGESIRSILYSIFTLFGEQFGIMLAISHFRAAVHGAGSIEEVERRHADRTEQFKSLYAKMQAAMMRIIARARAAGTIKSSLPDTVLARYLGSLIRGTMFEWKIAGELGNIDEEVGNIMTFLCEGMKLEFNPDLSS